MITGYNTDIRHGDRVFHVQTEDKGESNPCIESLVYVGGQILARKRAGYRRLLEGGEGKQAILDLMERQHRLMIAEIRTGKLDDQVRALVGEAAAGAAAAPALPEAAPPPPVETKTPSGPSLDQVILDYLNSEVEQEHLVLMMDSRGELRLGERALLSFHTQSSKGSRPIAGTRIAVKMISTSTEPQVLASGETNEHGDLNVSIAIPDLKTGTAALIVNAVSEVGTAEIKQLIWVPGPATIRLRVNGEQREVAAGSSVEDLVRGLGHDSRAVAVERNGSILRRADYAATPLAAGDRIEIVRFVQGGRGVYNLPGVGR